MLSALAASSAHLPVGLADRLSGLLVRLRIPSLEARARGQAAALAAPPVALGAARLEPRSAPREAVRRHLLFVWEFLAELGGKRFPVEDRLPSAFFEAAPHGRLLATLHMGNWIVGSRTLAERVGPVASVAGVQLRPGWNAELRARLSRLGLRVHEDGRAAHAFVRHLRAGGTVGLHLDGDRGRGRDESRTSPGVRSVVGLAAATGAEVWFVLCRRIEPGRFVIEGDRVDANSPDELEHALLERWRRAVEAAPEDWLIFRPEAWQRARA